MSLRIKIDLKKQKIFNSFNMSDKEDFAKGDSDNLSQTSASSASVNDVVSAAQDPSIETISITKNPQMAVPFSNNRTVEAVSDNHDSLEVEAISDADDTLAMEAVSDADESPAMEAVSDADDLPAMEAVSDADDLPAMETISDADDPHAMEAVSDADDLPAMEAVSDADDLPTVEADSDSDDPPAMEAVFDADDPPPAIKAISDAGDPPPMETVSDADDAVLDTSNPLSTPVVSDDVPRLVDSTSDVCQDVKVDHIGGVSTSSKTDVEKKGLEMDVSHSNTVDCSSEIAECAEDKKTLPYSSGFAINSLDKEPKNDESGEAYAADLHYTDSVKKNSENGEAKGDVNSKQSSNSEFQDLGNNSTSLKTSVVVSNVQAEFSDNEDSEELSPQNKLLEVIFKEDDEDEVEDNMDAFIPEVECTVEEAEEGNSDELTSAQSKGDSEKFITAEEDTVLTATESGSAVEAVSMGGDTVDGNSENKADGEEDTFVDVTSSYSAESCDVDETMQTYAKEFLYSDTSSLGPEPPDVTSSEVGKRPSLSRFPQIAKTVGTADYSLLQEMYKLLYLRNPWDTKEVLSSRILDFSGFHFSQDSEDYFNREVILRGLPQKTLEAIAHLLCFSKPISARSNKQRVNLATRIMKFLKCPEKPKRSRPASNTTAKAKAKPAAISIKPVSTPDVVEPSDKAATPKSTKPSRSRKSAPSRLVFKSSKKEPEVKVKIENTKKESTIIPVTERNISRGKMKWSDLKLPEVKVELTKMELSDIRKATKLKVNDETCSKTSKPGDADEATDTDTSEQVFDEEIKKLKEFPEVLSNIEGTPEKILSDIHYLLYLEDASLKDLKSNVMEFRGFPVEDGPNEVEERKQFLDKMSDDIIKNLANTFYLKCTNNKEENINLIIGFLKAPSKRYMKEAAEAPDKMLFQRNTDLMDGLSDSDDSITCEIVPKKVDCIDLISSGEEEEEEGGGEEKEEEKVQVKKEEELPGRPSKRCLHDFETITKIVNTHPHEYLIDIYNLLYQRTCEPSTLRKEILEFTGFDFEKGSDEYVKRKQYLDRMQYNNVRRIFNTLIHNTRDVRVFSKPTMIGEIFQFLFKLPDTDTSIRPPPQKTSVVVPVTPKEKEKVAVNPTLINVVNKADPPQAPNNARLSELKRVFQRVACFPCEYLVDVHKLLFMKDCDMKDIRQNIFAFKGFPFGVDSQEFKQRKMYLEYLTFHSLRKISSVLTTKNVDLRNSTKHELSTHLTKVLTEYTNTYMEAEAQEASSQAEEITAQANKAAVAAAQDPNVEKIVVTPVIEGFQAASTNDSTLPKVVDIRSQSKEASPKSKGKTSVTISVSRSSTISTPSTSQPRKKAKKSPEAQKPITQTFEKIIIPTVDQPEKQRRRKKANPTQRISEAEALTKAEQMGAAMQFQDIHLPEVESLVRSYQQNPSLMSTLCTRPQQQAPAPPTSTSNVGAVDNIRANYRAIIEQKAGGHHIGSPLGTTQFPLQMLYPQVRQNIPPPNVTVGLAPRPSVPFQIIRPFSMQPPIQNLYFNQSILNSSSPPLEPIYKDEEPGDYVGSLPVECILTEGGSGEPAAKKPKLAQLLTAPQGSLTPRNIPQATQPVQPMKKPVGRSSLESSDTSMKPSTSFHLKIRDAMTKASEDEEDCDKPLATLVGHPNDKVLKQQICEIVENTDLQDITINGVIQKIFNMYPKFNLNYRKEFIKSTLRSLLYRLGEQEGSKSSESDCTSVNPDSSVSTSGQGDSTKSQVSSPTKVPSSWSSASRLHKS